MTIPIPLSATDVRIYSNIPFSRDYRHVRWFNNEAERTTYFSTRTPIYSETQVKFQRHENMQGIFDCPVTLESLQTASYMVFKNESISYYVFIDNVEYINDRTTKVYFTIDVMQTLRFRMTFEESLVEREHCRRYNSSGKPIHYPLNEGIDYGDEYITQSIETMIPNGGVKFLVIIAKRAFHQGANDDVVPSVNGVVQGLTYYLHPIIAGDTVPNVKIGGTTYPLTEAVPLLKAMYNDTQAVENIVSMYYTWATGLQMHYTDDVVNMIDAQVERVEFVADGGFVQTLRLKQAYPYAVQYLRFNDLYAGVEIFPESKLMQYPYTVYVLSDLQGNQIELKPELFLSDDDIMVKAIGSMGTNNKIAFTVENYGIKEEFMINSNWDEYNRGIINETPNSIPVLSNYLSAYLQGNVNSIQSKMNSTFVNGVFGATGGIASAGVSGAKGDIGGVVGGLSGAAVSTKDSLLSFQSINAQLKDISNIPPNLNNQGSNSNYDFGNNVPVLTLFKKQIKPEYIELLSNYFKVFGYKINTLKQPNLRTRTHFNFVKLTQPNIKVTASRVQEETVKKIFQDGVTLWHVDDMMNYSVSNDER